MTMKNNMRHRQKYDMMGKDGSKKKSIPPAKKVAKPARPVIGQPEKGAAPFPSGGQAGKAMSPWPSTGHKAASAMRAAGKAGAPGKPAAKATKKAPLGGRLGKMLQKMTGSIGRAVGKGRAGGMGKGKAAPGKGKKKGLPGALGKALEKSLNGVGGLLGKDPGKSQGSKALFKNIVGNGPKGVKELGKAGPKAAKGAMELLGDMLGKGPGGVKSLGKDPKAVAGTRELVKHGLKNDPAGMKKVMGKGPRAEEGTKELFGNVLGKAKDGLGAFWGKAKGAAKGIFGDALGTAKETAGNVKHAITGTFGELKDAYGENWGAASKQGEPGEKKRSGWDKAWDFAGKVFGTGGKVVQKARTELAAGAVKLASQGVGRVADLVSTGLGDKARAAGDSMSEGVRKIGNGAADFRGDLIHGAIAGDSIKDPNAAQIVGNTGISFIPIAGQVADARDVVGGMAAKDPVRTLFAGLGFIPAAGDALKQSDHVPKLMKHGSKPVDALAGGMKKLIDKVPADIRKRAGEMWTNGKEKITGAKDWLISKFTKGDSKANTMGTSGTEKMSDDILDEVVDIGKSLQDRAVATRTDINDYIHNYKQSEEYLSLSNTQKRKIDRKFEKYEHGNMAVADVDVPGLKSDYKAHSQIHSSDDIASSVDDFSYTPSAENRIFENYVDDQFPRYNDTEAKILEDIASQIEDPNIKGTINLFSELDCCQSCSNLILEFRRKYPNIKLDIHTNNTVK